jgi:hypothetical protein
MTPQSKRAAGKHLRTAETAVLQKGSNDHGTAPGREGLAGGDFVRRTYEEMRARGTRRA